MKKKILVSAVAAAMGIGFSAVSVANDDLVQDSVRGMFYVNVPFGSGEKRDSAPILGFALYRQQDTSDNSGFIYSPDQFQQVPSYADIRYNMSEDNWSKFEVGHVNALTYQTVHNADGSTETEATGISTGAIVAGVVLGAVIAHRIMDDDDDDESTGSGSGGGE